MSTTAKACEDRSLAGKVAPVTGASRGIGLATARALTLPRQACMEFFELHPTIDAPPEPATRK